MYRYNYTTGDIDRNPALSPELTRLASAEIPRYIALWNQRFRPISVVGYKVRLPIACGAPLHKKPVD
jgi:hypothetical protein